MGSKTKHDKLTDKIYKELKRLNIDWIQKNVEYDLGECDLLLKIDNQMIYYEIKSNFSRKSYNKGIKQIHRFMNYFPGNIGVFYSPQYTEVIYE